MSWPLVKLGELVTIKGGGTPSKKVKEYWNGNIPWASVKDLKTSYISKTVDSITKLGVSNSATNIIPAGTILTATRMALGKFAINTVDMAINQDLKALFVNDDTNVDRDFLIRFLESKAQYIDSEGKGATVKGVTLGFLKSLEIPLPPLDEQKRIAAILDKADAIRRKRQQAINLADDFLRSVFLDMFGDPVTNPKGWEKVSMADFGTFKNGLNFGRGESGNSLHCLGVGNFKSLDRIEDVSVLSKVELNKLPAEDYLLKNNDLVFVRSNGNKALVGRCVTIHPGEQKVTFSGFCIRYRIENIKLDANFLNLCLRIPSMKNEMLQGGQGANIQNINQKLLASLSIPLPPIEHQNSFSDLVANFRLLLTKKQNSLKGGSELFNSLSQKAFAGKL